MNKFFITIVFIISFCLPMISFAQDIDKKWELGIGGGYYVGTEEEDGMLRIRDDRIQSYERLVGSYEISLDSEPIFYVNAGYRFKDYGFFVPLSLVGKKVWVDGKISRKKLSVKDARHYLEDAGAPKEEINAITRPVFEHHFIAKGVKVLKK